MKLALTLAALLISTMASAGQPESSDQLLYQACPWIPKLIASGEATLTREGPYDSTDYGTYRDYGWREQMTFTVRLADSVPSLPREWYARGHHCRFDLGATGILAVKSPCQRLCNLQPQRRPVLIPFPS
ncbi:hypothetical protein D3C85_1506490 [compost metagenome]